MRCNQTHKLLLKKKKKKDSLLNGRIEASMATMENSMKVPQKTKNKVTIWSSNLSSWNIPIKTIDQW